MKGTKNMNENFQKQLAELYNILFNMKVQGDGAFNVVNCMIIVRNMLHQIKSEEQLKTETDTQNIEN